MYGYSATRSEVAHRLPLSLRPQRCPPGDGNAQEGWKHRTINPTYSLPGASTCALEQRRVPSSARHDGSSPRRSSFSLPLSRPRSSPRRAAALRTPPATSRAAGPSTGSRRQTRRQPARRRITSSSAGLKRGCPDRGGLPGRRDHKGRQISIPLSSVRPTRCSRRLHGTRKWYPAEWINWELMTPAVQSARSATLGSTRAARSAGARLAITATTSSTPTTPA